MVVALDDDVGLDLTLTEQPVFTKDTISSKHKVSRITEQSNLFMASLYVASLTRSPTQMHTHLFHPSTG